MNSIGPLSRVIAVCLLSLAVTILLVSDFVIRKQAVSQDLQEELIHLRNDLNARVRALQDPLLILNSLTITDLDTSSSTPIESTFLAEAEYYPEANYFSVPLDKINASDPVLGSLKGSGDYRARGPGFYREMDVILRQAGLMNSMAKAMPELTRIYYFSREQFVLGLPSPPSSLVFNLNSDLLHKFHDMARPYQNPGHELFWTLATVNAETDEISATILKPVYADNVLRGLTAIDVDIHLLSSHLPAGINDIGRLMLVDAGNHVLTGARLASKAELINFAQALPDQVGHFITHPFDISIDEFIKVKNTNLLRQEIAGPGWHLILEVSDSELTKAALSLMDADLVAAVLLIILCLLVMRSWYDRSRLQESRGRYNAIFRQSTAPQIIVAGDGSRILNVNAAACSLFGFSRQTLKDIPLTNLIISKAGAQELYNSLSEKGVTVTKCRVADGQERDLEIYKSTLTLDNRMCFYLVIHDITERVRTEQHVRYQAYFDPLTQLPNRNHLFEHLRQLIASHRREEQTLALLFIDLDRFKQVNDNLGHDIGDKLLQQVAHRLRDRLRESDMLSRLGGDEFTVILPHLRDEMDASHVAKTLLTQLHEPFHIESYEVGLGASIGITIYPRDGSDPSTLLKHADIAMYKAKDNGRNQFRFFEDQMNREAKHRSLLEIDIQNAVRSNQFLLEYQPIFSAQNGILVGIEALLRWDHPRLGILKPEDFMFIAEETGVIVDISDWVLQQVHLHYVRFCGECGSDDVCPFISLNISHRQLMHENHLQHWREILQTDNRFAKNVLLEITEGILNSQLIDGRFGLSSLLNLGPKICLDDFGKPNSTLKALRQFPISVLKVDRLMIKNVLTSPTDAAYCRAIISLARTLEIKVSAEGVETKEQYDWLREAGCDFIQGYYLGREGSADEIARLLQRQMA